MSKSNDNAIENSESVNTLVRLTRDERDCLLKLIRENCGMVFLFSGNSDLIDSLYEKGFLVRDSLSGFLRVSRNVELLVEIEGAGAFDGIVK